MPTDKQYECFQLVSLRTALGILLAIHLFGLTGLLILQTRPWFEAATPFTILLSAALLFCFHQDWNVFFLTFIFITYITGFGIEVLGVNTHMVFGEYSYKTALGFKLLDVPIIIGINWLMLVYACGTIFHPVKSNFIIKSLLAATLMTSMDFIIEPIAITHNFWNWADQKVPLQNYAAWFLVSFILLNLFYLLPFHKKNPLAKYFIAIELSFFLLLRTGNHLLS